MLVDGVGSAARPNVFHLRHDVEIEVDCNFISNLKFYIHSESDRTFLSEGQFRC